MTIENPENLNILENSSHENPNSFIEAEEVIENKESKKSFREKTSEKIKELRDKISGSFSKKPNEGKEPLSEEELVSKKASQIGFSLEEFGENEDWKNLSNGQKMLALEQISQNTLLNVKQMGEERFAQKLKESGLLGKIGKNIRKSYWISKEEKQVLEDVRNGEVKPKTESVEVIIKHLKELNLDTTIDSTSGKPIIQFAKIPENCPEEFRETLEEYNKIANEFSKIPARFSNKNLASKSEFKKFKELEEKFKNAQHEAIEEQSRVDGEFKTLDNTANEEFRVRALQSKLEHPDAFKALDHIDSELSYGRFFNSENTFRVGYSALGFGLRKGTGGALGVAAAPAVACVIGILKGLRNADKKIKDAYIEGQSTITRQEKKEQLKELKKQAEEENSKWGAEDYNPEKVAFIAGQINEFEGKKDFGGKLKNFFIGEKKKGVDVDAFVNIDDLNKRLKKLGEKLEECQKNTDNNKKSEVYFELVRRVDFINKKYKEGLINFGTKNPISEKYELLKKMANLQTTASPYKTIDGIKYRFKNGSTVGEYVSQENTEVIDKLKKLQRKINNNFQNNQVKIMNEEVVRGVANAVLFSSLAVGIREWYQGSESQEFINESFKKGGEVVGGVFKDVSHGYAGFKAWMSGSEDDIRMKTDTNNSDIKKIFSKIEDDQKELKLQDNPKAFKKAFEESNRSENIQGVYKEKPYYNPKLKNNEDVAKDILKNNTKKESILSSLALVKKGDGVTNPLARQIEEMLKDPEQAKTLGFDGKNAHKFAIKKAAELAKEYGYIKPDGSEVRLGTHAIGHASYEVKMENGKLIVNETFDGKDMAEGNIDKKYEYSYKKEVGVLKSPENSVTPENHISKTDPMSKFSKLYIENLRNQPLYEQLKNQKVSDILNNPLAAKEFELIKSMEGDIKKSTGIDINPKTNETLKTYLDRLTAELNTNEKVLKTTKGVLPDFKFLHDKNSAEWIDASKPTVDGETKLAQDMINDKNNHLGQELKKYHDYVKSETGKDIPVKSDDTAETYKKALDETMKSSGKSIPTEDVKIKSVKIPKKELEKPLEDIKPEINKNGHIEKVLSGTEKTDYLNKVQKNTLDQLNSNLEDLKKVPSASKKIEELLKPSDSSHTRVVLEGSNKDLRMARNSIDNYYKDNAVNLEGDSKKINITLIEDNGNKLVRTALNTSVSEPTIIEEFTIKDPDGTNHVFRVIEIEKIKKFE